MADGGRHGGRVARIRCGCRFTIGEIAVKLSVRTRGSSHDCLDVVRVAFDYRVATVSDFEREVYAGLVWRVPAIMVVERVRRK